MLAPPRENRGSGAALRHIVGKSHVFRGFRIRSQSFLQHAMRHMPLCSAHTAGRSMPPACLPCKIGRPLLPHEVHVTATPCAGHVVVIGLPPDGEGGEGDRTPRGTGGASFRTWRPLGRTGRATRRGGLPCPLVHRARTWAKRPLHSVKGESTFTATHSSFRRWRLQIPLPQCRAMTRQSRAHSAPATRLRRA